MPYGGPPLAARRTVQWRVRAWDAAGAASAWSEPASFEVELAPATAGRRPGSGSGPVRESFTPPSQPGRPDPVADALRPAPYLRRSFTLAGPVAAARLHVTALGLYEARLNGQRVGDAFLAPGWTDYGQRVLYQTYDVTGLLRDGRERARRDPRRRLVLRVRRVRRQARRRALRPRAGTARPAGDHPRGRHHGRGW